MQRFWQVLLGSIFVSAWVILSCTTPVKPGTDGNNPADGKTQTDGGTDGIVKDNNPPAEKQPPKETEPTKDDPGVIQPQSGLWKYDEYKASENACKKEEVISNGNGTFQLVNNGNGTFTVTPGDGTNPFPCTLTGKSFTCPSRAWRTVDTGLGAKLQVNVIATGTFSSATQMSGEQVGTATCEGANCTAAALALNTSFPCSFKVAFNAKHAL